MPSFQRLTDDQRTAIIHFLQNTAHGPIRAVAARPAKSAAGDKKAPDFPYDPPYVSRVWEKLYDQDGYPAVRPPWGGLRPGGSYIAFSLP